MKNKKYLKPSLYIVICKDKDVLTASKDDVIVEDTTWGELKWKE